MHCLSSIVQHGYHIIDYEQSVMKLVRFILHRGHGIMQHPHHILPYHEQCPFMQLAHLFMLYVVNMPSCNVAF